MLQYNTGGINIDECRVPYASKQDYESTKVGFKEGSIDKDYTNVGQGFRASPLKTNNGFALSGENGRFPANVIHDGSDNVIKGMPETSSTGSTANFEKTNQDNITHLYTNIKSGNHFDDSGSASRYFYCAKASKKDRDEGLEAFESFKVNDGRKAEIDNAYQRGETLRKNTHPTVKPIELMQYLIRLVTPKNGTILDCFMGSGSTGKAAMFENRERNAGYKFIGIELTEEYLPICKARIDYGKYKYEYDIKQEQANDIKERGYMQPSIFDFYGGE